MHEINEPVAYQITSNMLCILGLEKWTAVCDSFINLLIMKGDCFENC